MLFSVLSFGVDWFDDRAIWKGLVLSARLSLRSEALKEDAPPLFLVALSLLICAALVLFLFFFSIGSSNLTADLARWMAAG